ncbi:MAG: hypothetical protein N3A02_01240 [Rectinema sp.]|nr:hypothetical protein [Rectinema sp.]
MQPNKLLDDLPRLTMCNSAYALRMLRKTICCLLHALVGILPWSIACQPAYAQQAQETPALAPPPAADCQAWLSIPSLPILLQTLSATPLGSCIQQPWFGQLAQPIIKTMATAGDRFPLHRFLTHISSLTIKRKNEATYIDLQAEFLDDLASMAQTLLSPHSVDLQRWQDDQCLVTLDRQQRRAHIALQDPNAKQSNYSPFASVQERTAAANGSLLEAHINGAYLHPLLGHSDIEIRLHERQGLLMEITTVQFPQPIPDIPGEVGADDIAPLPHDALFAFIYKRPPAPAGTVTPLDFFLNEVPYLLAAQGVRIDISHIQNALKLVRGVTCVLRTPPAASRPEIEWHLQVEPEHIQEFIQNLEPYDLQPLETRAWKLTIAEQSFFLEHDPRMANTLRLSTQRLAYQPGFGLHASVRKALQLLPRPSFLVIVTRPGPWWASLLHMSRDAFLQAQVPPQHINDAIAYLNRLDLPGISAFQIRDGMVRCESTGLLGGPGTLFIAYEMINGYRALVDQIVAQYYRRLHGRVTETTAGSVRKPLPP